MDLPLFATMQKLGCKHLMDMVHDPIQRAKVASVATYYRGMHVNMFPNPQGGYVFIYASLESGIVYRKVTADVLREFTIRRIDHNRLLGIPYEVHYEVPVSPAEPRYNPNSDKRNAGVEDAVQVIVVGIALAVTASVLFKRFMNDSSNPTKGKK